MFQVHGVIQKYNTLSQLAAVVVLNKDLNLYVMADQRTLKIRVNARYTTAAVML